MWNEKWEGLISLIERRVKPALGCTEPVSTALAAAYATQLLKEEPERLEVYVSGNLLKNAMGVGIPGTGKTGLPIAAALGAICGDIDKGLEVLANVTQDMVAKASAMVAENLITVTTKDTSSVLYSEVIAFAGEHQSRVIISDDHTFVALKELNGKIIDEQTASLAEENTEQELSIAEIYEFATTADINKLSFINEAAKLNSALMEAGLNQDCGLNIGRAIQKNITKGYLSNDLVVSAMMCSAAASDARMSGVMLPAMSNSGSGNQGVSATMPVVAVAQKIGASDEQLTRALIMSHLTAIHIKQHMNTLSALCAATTAAAGASAAITWLLGGQQKQVEYALFNMFGDISGILCDGAGTGCSLKVSTSAQAAVKAALMAKEDICITCCEGIIENGIEETIDNIGDIANQGLQDADRLIIKIMTDKV